MFYTKRIKKLKKRIVNIETIVAANNELLAGIYETLLAENNEDEARAEIGFKSTKTKKDAN